MTEAEKAAALADEIDNELNELRGRFANRENDHFSFGLKFSSWDIIARALRLLAETEARPAGDLPSDGTCVRCGSAPRSPSGLCATCLDEDAEKHGNTYEVRIPTRETMRAALIEYALAAKE